MMKTKIYILLIVLIAFSSCSKNKAEENNEAEENNTEASVVLNKNQQEALGLKIGDFQMRNLTSVIKINGQLEVAPENTAAVTAIIGGNVKSIKVFVGDKVKKRQTLAILEHPDYIKLQEDFSVVANNLEFLKNDFDRQKELFENNAASGKDYQKAKADYNIAKSKYQGLKSRLELLHLSPEKVKNGQISSTINIQSPISGFVNEVDLELGTYVNAQYKMFEITDNSTIHADFLVYEKDVYLLKIGQEIHFTVANQPNVEFMAKVFAIAKKFDENTRAIHIHSRIQGNVKGLVPGMYITGHLHADKNYTKTLPNDAIIKEGTKSYIFAVEKQEENLTIYKMIEVITGKQDEDYTEIKVIDSLAKETKLVLNQAYYLFSEMKKEEMGEDD